MIPVIHLLFSDFRKSAVQRRNDSTVQGIALFVLNETLSERRRLDQTLFSFFPVKEHCFILLPAWAVGLYLLPGMLFP